MENIFVLLHIVVAILIIGLVMIQHGKGAEAGASLNSTSQSIFGSQGSSNFLVKLTTYLAIGFFVTSLFLAQIGVESRQGDSLIDSVVPAVESHSDIPADVQTTTSTPAPIDTTLPASSPGESKQEPKP